MLRGEFIKNENAISQEFVDYYVEAGHTAEHKDQTTHEMSSKYMKVEKDIMDLSFKWINYDNLKIHEEDYKELTTNLVEMGLQENPPTFADFVDNSLIDKAK